MTQQHAEPATPELVTFDEFLFELTTADKFHFEPDDFGFKLMCATGGKYRFVRSPLITETNQASWMLFAGRVAVILNVRGV
jgi:hypothetical protein